MTSISLADAIADLRSELARAMQRAEKEEIRFGLGPVELELELAVTKEGGAGRRQASGCWSSAPRASWSMRTHRLKLVLEPEIRGERLRVSSARPRPQEPSPGGREDEPEDQPDASEPVNLLGGTRGGFRSVADE